VRPVVVIGDVLLDEDVDGRSERLCPDAPAPVLDVEAETARPGGAGLAATLLAADGVPVRLVTALSSDDAGRRLRDMLESCVHLVCGPAEGGTAVKTRLRAGGRVLLRADRGDGRAGRGFGAALRDDLLGDDLLGDELLGDGAGGVLDGAAAVLVSDYGRGVAADPVVRAALGAAACRGVPVVWDPHPRGPAPVPGVAVVTPNLGEACGALDVPPPADGAEAHVLDVAARLLEHWGVRAVAITLGARGAVVRDAAGCCCTAPARRAAAGDPCGAGDRFAGRVAGRLAAGAPLDAAVVEGVRAASEFVAGGGAGAVRRTRDGWRQPQPTANGTVVVAT
jgi:D-beta-D-heptose 7-phosphate kinase/D-beta-D-heptose 1-phosphate adenosyltransferase